MLSLGLEMELLKLREVSILLSTAMNKYEVGVNCFEKNVDVEEELDELALLRELERSKQVENG